MEVTLGINQEVTLKQKKTKMRKVIGIGETVFDIIFKNDQPVAAKPGGSTFNALISLGRMGVFSQFISETGNDKVGDIIINFLKANYVDSSFVYRYDDGKSAISLAFLDANQDAEYTFYKDYPKQRIEALLPEINQDDIVLFGSYFALNPKLRPIINALLEKAKANDAIIYYDPNFRSSHLHEVDELLPALIENFKNSDIVRGSDEDFKNILKTPDFEHTHERLKQYTATFIYTRNKNGVNLGSYELCEHFKANPITPISTIGAGDNFNAGIAYAFIANNIRKKDIPVLSKDAWKAVIETAMQFSQNVCESYDNYISSDFAEKLKK